VAGSLQAARPVSVYTLTREFDATGVELEPGVQLAGDQSYVTMAMRSWILLDGLQTRKVQ
jgi:hypothetical protein